MAGRHSLRGPRSELRGSAKQRKQHHAQSSSMTNPRSVHPQLAQCQSHGDGAVVRRKVSSRSRNKVRRPVLKPLQNSAFGGVFLCHTAKSYLLQAPDLEPKDTLGIAFRADAKASPLRSRSTTPDLGLAKQTAPDLLIRPSRVMGTITGCAPALGPVHQGFLMTRGCST